MFMLTRAVVNPNTVAKRDKTRFSIQDKSYNLNRGIVFFLIADVNKICKRIKKNTKNIFIDSSG